MLECILTKKKHFTG